jgi:NAD(P)H-hydrate epimerase
MKQLEEECCTKNGKSLIDLMEDVGAQVAAFIMTEFSALKTEKSKILILSGPGNNGGDGLVAGRLLLADGYDVQVIVLAANKYSAELQHQIELYHQQKIPLSILLEDTAAQVGYVSVNQLTELIAASSLVIDCLLGTGQHGNPRDLVKSACRVLVASKEVRPDLNIISVDAPTGIDCEGGAIFDPHITPDITLVIQHLKHGQVQQPALEHLGQIVILDADIDCEDIGKIAHYSVLAEGSPLLLLKPRSKLTHKGDLGHVLVLGGSQEMPGAAILSATSALRSGAGLVTQLCFGNSISAHYPEIMYLKADSGFSTELVQKIAARMDQFSCIVLGPGLGLGQAVTSFVFEVLREVQLRNLPCVLDADGLSAVAELLKLGVPLHLPTVIMTPHPGEAARLLNISSSEVQANRYQAVEKLSSLCRSTVVLKGASSLCFDGKEGVVNPSGGPFLATAGSGDVLAGMIASFYGSGLSSLSAASLGVYLHGIAGELAQQDHGGPIIASDIISKIPYAIGKHVTTNSQ